MDVLGHIYRLIEQTPSDVRPVDRIHKKDKRRKKTYIYIYLFAVYGIGSVQYWPSIDRPLAIPLG